MVLKISLFPLQGTPLKFESGNSVSAKKHDVRSIIGNPGLPFHPLHPMEVLQDHRTIDRVYDEMMLKSRPGSITRGAPVIVPDPGKPRHSPLAYEEHQLTHGGSYSSHHLNRGSPVTTRESAQRQAEGINNSISLTIMTIRTHSHQPIAQWLVCSKV